MPSASSASLLILMHAA